MQEDIDRINNLRLWDFEVVENTNRILLILGNNDFDEVRIGRVYYYEREDLKPGERIASRGRRGTI